MTTLQGYVSTAGEYTPTENEVLSAQISDTDYPDEPGIVYANPKVPYQTIQNLAVGSGGRTISSPGSGGNNVNSKQLVIVNDPRAALRAVADLGLQGILINEPPRPQVVGSNG